eukprot:1160994-Pelagomonas_calceolata.AAC.17
MGTGPIVKVTEVMGKKSLPPAGKSVNSMALLYFLFRLSAAPMPTANSPKADICNCLWTASSGFEELRSRYSSKARHSSTGCCLSGLVVARKRVHSLSMLAKRQWACLSMQSAGVKQQFISAWAMFMV